MGKLYLVVVAVATLALSYAVFSGLQGEQAITQSQVDRQESLLAREVARAGVSHLRRILLEDEQQLRPHIVDPLIEDYSQASPLRGTFQGGSYRVWAERVSPVSYRIVSEGRYAADSARWSEIFSLQQTMTVEQPTASFYVRFRGQHTNSCLALFLQPYRKVSPEADPDNPDSWIAGDPVLLLPISADNGAGTAAAEIIASVLGVNPYDMDETALWNALADTTLLPPDVWTARELPVTLQPGDRFNLILGYSGRCNIHMLTGWYYRAGEMLVAYGTEKGRSDLVQKGQELINYFNDPDRIDPWDWTLDMFPDRRPAFEEPIAGDDFPAWRETPYALILPHPDDPTRFLIGFNDESDSYVRRRNYCYVDGVRDLSYKCSNAYRNANPGHDYQIARNEYYDWSDMLWDVKANGYGDTEWKLREDGRYSFGGRGWYDPSWPRDRAGFPYLVPYDFLYIYGWHYYYDPVSGLSTQCGRGTPAAWAPASLCGAFSRPAELEEVRNVPDFYDTAVEVRMGQGQPEL